MYWPLNVPRVFAIRLPSTAAVLLNDVQNVAPVTLPAASETIETEDAKPDSISNLIGDPYDGEPPPSLDNLIEEDETHALHDGNLVSLLSEGDDQHNRATSAADVNQEEERDDSSEFIDAVETRDYVKRDILAIKVARNGQLFATITEGELAIWQVRPTAVVAHVVRSQQSLGQYGSNIDLLIRPDSQVFVVQTTAGYLITYSLQSDPLNKVYRTTFAHKSSGQANGLGNGLGLGIGEGGGVREYSLRFRMVIKVDAGISRALAWDEELIVATSKPAAVQCIRWNPDSGSGSQTSTELVSRMSWITGKKVCIKEMVHDRPMNLSCWITSDGHAYAIQRVSYSDSEVTGKLFKGYCFHAPINAQEDDAIKVSINARFSLLAVGTASGKIQVYNARDYVGNIPLSHTIIPPVSKTTSGEIKVLAWSPDGYALFAGFETGWALWSVYGKMSASSFRDSAMDKSRGNEAYQYGLRDCAWLPGGGEILLCSQTKEEDGTTIGSENIWMVEMARSAVTGLFNAANIARTVLITSSKLLIYRGHEQSALQTLSTEQTLWHNVPIPPTYLIDNYPLRQVVISPDGRYVAVAGRRGLAHYSVNSGRWKTFVNESMENEFVVRGGMCWYHHILIVAVETEEEYEIRLYSRELELDNTLLLHVETVPSPIVLVALVGDDGILVYCNDNALYHFIVTTTKESISLKLVGQITFHGIIRAPARVRSISWILPEDQLRDGDPSQDVALATVMFLVDGKLVVLQPSTAESGELKYDMRVIIQNVEYYALMRDLPIMLAPSHYAGIDENGIPYQTLNDSLWVFDGQDIKTWMDVQDILDCSPEGRDLPTPVKVPVDFYPLSVLMTKGIVSGVEVDIVERKDIGFSYFRLGSRTHLFFQHLLRHHLTNRNEAAAIGLARLFETVSYFEHALEVLLHVVLDDEADSQPDPEVAVLPLVVRFLSNFPDYLNVIVQCTRKTEVASWSHLFSVVGSPQVLFEESLARGLLKTAGGYLLILHTMEKLSSSSQDMVRLFSRAVAEEDWDLCKELARFLTALDNSGKTLKEALELVDLRSPVVEEGRSFMFEGTTLELPGLSRNGTNGSSNSSPFFSRGGSPDRFEDGS